MGINEIAIESVEPLRLLPLEDLCCAIMSDLEGLLAPEDNVTSLTWYTCSIGAQQSRPSGARLIEGLKSLAEELSSSIEEEGSFAPSRTS